MKTARNLKGLEIIYKSRGSIIILSALILTVFVSLKREDKLPYSYLKDHDYGLLDKENTNNNDVIQFAPQM